MGPVLLAEQRAVHQDQRPFFESNSDGIRNYSRFGIGTVPFSTYVSPLSKIIPDTVKFHQYADDTQLYCSISTSEFASEVTRLQDCVRDVSDRFLTNCMQLNGDKSEAVLFALGAQAAKVDPQATVGIAGSAMELSADIRSLGVHMDGQLNMDRHVNSECSSFIIINEIFVMRLSKTNAAKAHCS